MLPVATQLDEEQIRSLFEGAFSPLCCDIKFNTYEGVIEFSISKLNGEQVLPRRKLLTITQAKNESFLRSTLSLVRQDIEETGIPLLPWPGTDK